MPRLFSAILLLVADALPDEVEVCANGGEEIHNQGSSMLQVKEVSKRRLLDAAVAGPIINRDSKKCVVIADGALTVEAQAGGVCTDFILKGGKAVQIATEDGKCWQIDHVLTGTNADYSPPANKQVLVADCDPTNTDIRQKFNVDAEEGNIQFNGNWHMGINHGTTDVRLTWGGRTNPPLSRQWESTEPIPVNNLEIRISRHEDKCVFHDPTDNILTVTGASCTNFVVTHGEWQQIKTEDGTKCWEVGPPGWNGQPGWGAKVVLADCDPEAPGVEDSPQTFSFQFRDDCKGEAAQCWNIRFKKQKSLRVMDNMKDLRMWWATHTDFLIKQ